jgi:hypothetical protein
MRVSITAGRPIRIGVAMPSSSASWAARSTRSSSPSANATRLAVDARAAPNTGRITMPVEYTKRLRLWR